jgi:Leucine-rich repeat (LRR) protein
VERSIGLKSLTFLCCTKLHDVSALVACTALEQIKLQHLSVNLGSLKGLDMIPNLNSVIFLGPMHISHSITQCIAKCASLRTLHIEDAGPLTLDGLDNMTSLQSLTLINTPNLEDLDTLGNLPALTEFSLQNTPLRDVSVIGTCSALQKLDIKAYNCKIFWGLEALTVLHTAVLACSWNCNVSAIVSIASLRRLELQGQDHHTLSRIVVDPGFVRCTALTDLKIVNASIPGFDVLRIIGPAVFPFRQLRKVWLVGPPHWKYEPDNHDDPGNVCSLSMLARCERLEYLKMQHCDGYPMLSESLARIRSLTTVVLIESPIEDVSELLTLPRLQTLKLKACNELREIRGLDTALVLKSLKIRDCIELEYVESARSCLTVTVEGECPWTLMAKSREGHARMPDNV